MRLSVVVAWLGLGVVLPAPSARAQATDEAEVDASIDISRGPITGGPRLLGLGGAFVALAEGTDGVISNPASVAVRPAWSWTRWAYDWGFDVGVGAWLPETEFFPATRSDELTQTSALFGNLAAVVQREHVGVGVSAGAQSHALRRGATSAGLSPADLTANYGLVHLSIAHGFLDGQIAVGIGPRLTGVSFDASSRPTDLVAVTGVGLQAGAIFKPAHAPYRLGAVFKTSITPSTSADDSDGLSASSVHVPWQVVLGAAYQLGRPLSPPTELVDSADEAGQQRKLREYWQRPKRYVLFSSELRLLEPVNDRIDLVQYWQGAVLSPDKQLHASPSFGIESEVLPSWLRLRAGAYYEPATTTSGEGRLHGTFGFDVKLLHWDVFGLVEPFDGWALSAAADSARAYLNTTFSVGLWR